jgi:subtilase family serine protease
VVGFARWGLRRQARPHFLANNRHVALPCGNPANHILSVGRFDVARYRHRKLARVKPRIKPAARVTAGEELRCFGLAVARGRLEGPELVAGPVGLGPAQIQSAYKLSGQHADGRTVAIVDAYNDPTAESDLATFRKAYGLAPCTSARGCFKKVNQSGATSPLPSNDYGWSVEISLDLDAVSSACPDCHILLVEASNSSTASFDAAEDTAATAPGLAAVSNSWGGAESSAILADDAHFKHSKVAITASSGDNGYGVSWPASSPYVTAVGGTHLSATSNARGWSETAWDHAGSGCSAYEAKPAWQKDTGCQRRTVADVSAVADPASGLGIYDTANNCGTSSLCDHLIELGVVAGLDGWAQVGGTSLSSPLIASVYALAGNASSISYGSFPYSHTSALFDITSGSNGTCASTYLCAAAPGYDGPTGLGSPDGPGAF